MTSARKVAILGLLASSAVAMQVLEAPIPRPLPWLKPGLANSATLAALVLFGLSEASLLVLTRQVAANLLMGTLMAPSFILGLGGALSAALAMRVTLAAGSRRLGLVSISACGALASNLAQLSLADAMLGHHGVWLQLPLMMAASLPSGLLTGLLTAAMLANIPPEIPGRLSTGSEGS